MKRGVKEFIVSEWNKGASSEKIRSDLEKKFNQHYSPSSIRVIIARERKKGNAARAKERS